MNSESKYAKKLRSGQLYGPGCCAHTVTQKQIDAAKQLAYERGHFRKMFLSSSLPDFMIEG